MKCLHCKGTCIKKGVTTKGIQKYKCRECGKHQREEYENKAWQGDTNKRIITYLKESCGIRSISRIINISLVTVIKRIKQIARRIEKPDQVA